MYTLFVPQSYIQPAITEDQANIWFPIISIIGMPSILISMAISGTWSDRVGKRKPFVIWSSVGVANVATNIGKPLAPVAGGQPVALTIVWGSGYKAVHLMSAIIVFVGALGILKLSEVRSGQ